MAAPRKHPTPELLNLMRVMSDSAIERQFGIARNTLRKWRFEYGIPNPAKGAVPVFPESIPEQTQPRRERESAVLLASDLHYGKRTDSFNAAVLRQRLDALVPRLDRIHRLLTPAYELEELVVCFLGDVNDGSEIYPSQPHHQDVTDPLRQAWELAEYLAQWLTRIRRTWGNVRVEAVAGNHGRAGKRMVESASWDLAAYHYLALHLRDSGIPVGYAHEGLDPFLRVVEVRGHRFVLYHGHGIRMYQAVPWYGLAQRALRWRATLGEFAVLCCGHFHSYGEMDVNGIRILLTGTPVTDDAWALQALAAKNANRWHLFGVGSRRPVTWQFGLDLT